MNKKLLIGLGAVVAAGAAFYFLKGKQATLTPYQKMLKDVLDPSTQFGQSQRGYLKAVGADPESYDNLKSGADYRLSHPEDQFAKAYNAKASWLPNEVVKV